MFASEESILGWVWSDGGGEGLESEEVRVGWLCNLRFKGSVRLRRFWGIRGGVWCVVLSSLRMMVYPGGRRVPCNRRRILRLWNASQSFSLSLLRSCIGASLSEHTDRESSVSGMLDSIW